MGDQSLKSEYEVYRLGQKFDPGSFIQERIREIDEKFERLNQGLSREEAYSPSYLGRNNSEKLYDLVRWKSPEVVVETGVCNGLSTATLLKALEDNRTGELYSIDLSRTTEGRARSAVIPAGESPGWVVPDGLNGRWEFKEGNSIYRVPETLEQLHEKCRKVDIFLHDSEHSFEVVMIELSLAWKHMDSGGLLLADNVDFTPAFDLFAEAKQLKKYSLGEMGLLEK